MERKWTDDQLLAITRPCGPVLVSAAAGSGKTAVLVERVLRRLSVPEPEGCGIDRLLVVTFTNAAASEMRGKIAAALSARIAETPAARRLRRQLALLPQAAIGTVHAFCLSLIREHFAELGLSPAFRVADEAEATMLRASALERSLEALYAEGEKDFLVASEAFSSGRDDRRFAETILSVYDKLQSHPDPEDWMADAAMALSPEEGRRPGETVWGEILLERAAARIAFGLSGLRGALEEMKTQPDVFAAYAPAFSDDMEKGEQMLSAARSGDWAQLYHALEDYAPVKLRAVRKFEDKRWLSSIKEKRDEWRKLRGELSARLICADEEQTMEALRGSAPAVRGLFAAISAFSRAYTEEKRRKNLIDFADIEHMALALVTEKTEEGRVPSPLAQELSQRYAEVLVDEYQDTNGVQDLIFTALSEGGRRLFMVGDVKQSIYRFRMADPDIFLARYLSYPDAAEALPGKAARIILSKNFRSRRQVLETTNFIFSRVMTCRFGGLDYDDRELLRPGAEYPEPESGRYAAELLLLDLPGKGAEPPEEESEEKTALEARMAAARLRALLDEGLLVGPEGDRRPVCPGDMAILLRSVANKAPYFEKALRAEGIPCQTDDPGEFFMTAEILTLMSFLEILDNAGQDVPLLSVMRSPVYGFTADELARIRAAHGQTAFHVAVQLAAAEGDEKCSRMLRALSEQRMVVGDWPMSRLIWTLLTEEGLLRLFGAMEQGRRRQENLLAFYEYAREREGQTGGLGGFLRVVRKIRESGKPLPGLVGQGGEGVRILSIHKSKGLEFPVVVAADCAKLFNEEDARAPALFHPALGLGCKCRDGRFAAEYPTLARTAIAEKLRGEMLEEELRVLYVALTRAREKLIITLSAADADKLIEKGKAFCGYPPPEALRAARSPALWLTAPMAAHPSAGALFSGLTPAKGMDSLLPMIVRRVFPARMEEALREVSRQAGGKTDVLPALPEAGNGGLDPETPENPEHSEMSAEESASRLPPETVREIMEFRYRWSGATALPSKVTPAALKGRDKDGEAAEQAFVPLRRTSLREPVFSGTRPLTAAERGSAHHVAMQFVDFDRCGDLEGVRAEIGRLKELEILSAAQAEAVRPEWLLRFFRSPLFERMKKADELRREFKFSLLCPAERFFENAPTGEKLLLQGVVDCFFVEDGKTVVVDFKTDWVPPGGEAQAALRHRPQLEAYAYAMERITGRPTGELVLFFFETGGEATLAPQPM